MRIVVVSDTHGNYRVLEEILKRVDGNSIILHLGDGEREIRLAGNKFSNIEIVGVRGNCDYSEDLPDRKLLCVGGRKILMTHGHLLGVKFSLDRLIYLGKEEMVDIILFGHTHCRANMYQDGIYLLNPGSAAQPRDGLGASYGYIDITKAGIVANIVDIAATTLSTI